MLVVLVAILPVLVVVRVSRLPNASPTLLNVSGVAVPLAKVYVGAVTVPVVASYVAPPPKLVAIEPAVVFS